MICFVFCFQPLKIHGRVLVGEGVLTKMCRKRPKARQFFLFNDILVYGNIVISKKKYNKQHIIPLEEVQLQGLEDNGRKCHTSRLFHFFHVSIELDAFFLFYIFCVQNIVTDGSYGQRRNRLLYTRPQVRRSKNGWPT